MLANRPVFVRFVGVTGGGWASLLCPALAAAQASPFLTGATALQSNILAWLTPVAVILVMALGAMAMANRIVENCGNTFILRCSASEGGGTSRFASVLIGQRQVRRTSVSRSVRDTEWFGSSTINSHLSIEPAVMDSEIEQIPDLCGYLKLASRTDWIRVRMAEPKSLSADIPEAPAFVPAPVELKAIATSNAPEASAIPPEHETSAVKPKRRSRAKPAAAAPMDGDVIAPKRASRSRRVNGAQPPASSRQPSDNARGFEP
jgi:hypothetical protein